MKRKVLVILSNRFTPSRPARYIELDCKPDGSILKETPLKRAPKKPEYDEVWENDEGRTELSSCHRIKRKYNHALQKKEAEAEAKVRSPKSGIQKKSAGRRPKNPAP